MPQYLGFDQLPASLPPFGLIAQVTVVGALALTAWFFSPPIIKLAKNATAPVVSHITSCNPFFHRRLEFLRSGFTHASQKLFRFTLWRHKVVAISGEAGRQFFFTARDFNLNQGHQYLSGAIPLIPGYTSNIPPKKVVLIYKKIALLQKDDLLAAAIPLITRDSNQVMEQWGNCGTFNPFEKISELIFQLTLRTLACDELADNPALASQLKSLMDQLDRSTTPMAVLLPWFPSPSLITKYWTTRKIFNMISDAVRKRENGGPVSRTDALQILLAMGENRILVVGFIMGMIVAGARATAMTSSWIAIFLGCEQYWRDLTRVEVLDLLATYASYKPGTPLSLSSALELISLVPLSVWESSTPVLDKVIRETLRLAQPHTAMRKNLGPDLYFDGTVIPSGTYAVYSFGDVHLDEENYPDPWKFDPNRPEPKQAMGYIGWGGGKNLCQGTRLAKLEMKLVTAMLLAAYDFYAVDAAGNPITTSPRPDWNDHLSCPPVGGPVYVKYQRTCQ